jgi:two-component system chemotaxis response regulator CheB
MKTGSPITTLIVDDSPLIRRFLRHIFEGDPSFLVIGEASNGRQGVDMAVLYKPQLITMDLDMPEMNGFDAIEQIMAIAPTRILVVTGVPRYCGLDSTFEALSRGALELLFKPSTWPGAQEEVDKLLRTAKEISEIPVIPHIQSLNKKRKKNLTALPSPKKIFGDEAIIVIGASTGGPSALQTLLSKLPTKIGVPIVIVQHLAADFSKGLVNWLNSNSRLPVVEAKPITPLKVNTVYVGLQGKHLAFSSKHKISLIDRAPREFHCPSINVLFESAAATFGSNTIGVLLTGMGSDGAQGLQKINQAGGVSIAQDEASSSVFGMPRAAIELGAVNYVLDLNDITPTIIKSLSFINIGPFNNHTSRE